MSFLEDEVRGRDLPELLTAYDTDRFTAAAYLDRRKGEIRKIISEDFAGVAVRFPVRTYGSVIHMDESAFGGKAVEKVIMLTVKSDYNTACFPFRIVLPRDVKHPPLFVAFSFSPPIADSGAIADGMGEEIIDNGYALANIYYQDIAPDYYDEHKNGLGRFCARNPYDSWGKLKIWSWAASRVLDYVLEHENVDEKRVAVIGHSRLGKTALLAGAFDERFTLTVSNDSGAGGAALFRGKTGERLSNLAGRGSRLWFAGNLFKKYGEDETALPFDQHFLLALFAGRYLYVASASDDAWADPRSEFLSCVAASPAFALAGQRGLVTPDAYPRPGDVLHEGCIGYHLRTGSHYLGRYDWNRIFEYRKKHKV